MVKEVSPLVRTFGDPLQAATNFMKHSFSNLSLVPAALWSVVLSTNAQVNVTQHHNHDSRDGLYIDSAFTQSAAG